MAAGGITEIVNRFDLATGIKAKSSSHSHKSSLKDENTIISGLLRVKVRFSRCIFGYIKL